MTRIIDLKGLTRGDTIAFYVKGKGVTKNVSNDYLNNAYEKLGS